nr:hypothetical protein [Geotalea toluenoxydans]
MSPKKNFLSDEEMEKIRHAVAQAEEGTFGEIATMVVEESDSYREALLLGVLFISGFVALLVSITIQHVTIWSYIPLVLVLMLPCYQILKVFPRLKIFFVERKRLNEAVRDRAVKAFMRRGFIAPSRKRESSFSFPCWSTRFGSWVTVVLTRKSDPNPGKAWRHSWPLASGKERRVNPFVR